MSTQAAAPNGNTVNTVDTVKTVPTDVEVPQSEAEIDELRKEIDRLDAEILAAIKRRSEVSQIIGRTRMASGGPRLVHSREMKVLERFNELGQEGHTLAMLLLRLGRGRLGH
ncbi:chorismate mutase [Rhodococcus erythropolis]|jgi:chorismate mutase|uniref:chorismate mutase n=1 Tax=Rhodococcus TaxID=1827 RepID=UPI00197E4064|nr:MULTISPECIES: chorismate mutase [Rhodococcus]